MRSKHLVPGSPPERFAKAMAGPDDALHFDLHDAGDEARKGEARREHAKFLRTLPPGSGKTLIVRVNGLEPPHFQDDIEAIVGPGLDLVNVPKPESPDDIREAAVVIGAAERKAGLHAPIGILANIETPRAYRLAADIATADPRVKGLQVGWGDLIEPLNMDRYNPGVIESMLVWIRIAAGEAGVFAYDGAYANIKDPEGYRREAEMSRRLGYLGKSAIHPTQVPIANEVFRPTDAEIAHSLRVVEAAADAKVKGIGAFTVNGKMIDGPFIRRAEEILTLARRLNLVSGDERSIE